MLHVVGGPWITAQEDYFGNLADVAFIGEAEESWPLFLSEWSQGGMRAAISKRASPT